MKLGIDVGSTTVKLVVLNDEDQIIYSKYERHMSDVFDKVQELIIQMKEDELAPPGKARNNWS